MLTVRLATLDEADQVAAIVIDAAIWLKSQNFHAWDPATLPALMRPAVARGECYLAWLDDKPVATVTIQWSDVEYWGERPDDAGYIHKLVSTRAVGGQHIGEQVLAWSEQFIADHKRPFARLDCNGDNPFINRYYQAAGYELVGTLDLPELPLSLYEKRLNKS
jgi:protein-tyrosine phosphatase